MTLVELPGFLAKNQTPTGFSPLVKIPALTTHEVTFDLYPHLCPVQALKLYLESVSTFCGSRRCMFVKTDPTAIKEIHADHITKWVHSVVTEVYASV